jgi:putative ABC transport system permease protein
MRRLFAEMRFAVRSLRQTPIISLAAVICLALGIGATTAVFSAVSTALLTPLPFPEADRLVTIYRTTPFFVSGPFSPANFLDLRRETKSFESIAAFWMGQTLVEWSGASFQSTRIAASGALLPMLGARPVLGRLLTPRDERPEAPEVAVLSEEIWRDRFGADQGVIGQAVRLDGVPHTVVGILPRGFRVPEGPRRYRGNAWIPLKFSEQQAAQRRSNFLRLIGRLAPGLSLAEGSAELTRLMAGLVEAYPRLKGEGLRAVSLTAAARQAVRTPLMLLFGAVLLVLLVAASNVASLLLARGVDRQRELAIRAALGASPSDIARRVLAESLILVGVGLVLAVGLAWGGVRGIRSLAVERVPQLAGLGIDFQALGFSLVLGVGVAVLCGIVPALRGARVDPQETMRSTDARSGAAGKHRFLRGLAAFQVGLSVLLLLGAGLAIRGFGRVMGSDPGFETSRILTLQAVTAADRFSGGTVEERFLEPVLETIRAVPGVRNAAALNLIPYDTWGWNFNIRYEGQPGDDPARLPLVERRVASPGLFETLGMRLVQGRLFTDADGPDAPPVAVVNQALAARDFPGGDPIGKRFHLGDTTFATIIGVVADIRNAGPFEAPQPELYWSARQADQGNTAYSLMIATRGAPMSVTKAVEAAVRSVDPAAAVEDIRPMDAVIAHSVGEPRFYLLLLSSFAAVAVALALAGLYGVMSYVVAQRRREIGIRMALGSSRQATVGLVFGQGTRLIGLGLGLGLAGGGLLTRFMTSFLYGVSPLDPTTWLAVVGLLTVAGSLALVIPARRAARVDPLEAMRAD